MSEIIQVTDDNFEQTINSASVPLLVDFWAEWCGPCKMIAPILEELATEFDGQIQIAKLNIEDNPQTPAKFSVRGIPTLILFNNGEAVDTKVGAASKSQLSKFINENI